MQDALPPHCDREELLAKDLEHYITPLWAIEAITEKEGRNFQAHIHDPCTGTGVIAKNIKPTSLETSDIYDWGSGLNPIIENYLERTEKYSSSTTVIMNPPFSLATDFVDKAFALGAKNVICFQRLAWYEAGKRRKFWDRQNLKHIYICASRATCWRADLKPDASGHRYNPSTGKKLSNAPTVHAWFIINEPTGTNNPTTISRIYR